MGNKLQMTFILYINHENKLSPDHKRLNSFCLWVKLSRLSVLDTVHAGGIVSISLKFEIKSYLETKNII